MYSYFYFTKNQGIHIDDVGKAGTIDEGDDDDDEEEEEDDDEEEDEGDEN